MAIDLVSRGLINLKPLLSHKWVLGYSVKFDDAEIRYSWEDAKLAFETTRKAVGEDGKPAIKVMSGSTFLLYSPYRPQGGS